MSVGPTGWIDLHPALGLSIAVKPLLLQATAENGRSIGRPQIARPAALVERLREARPDAAG